MKRREIWDNFVNNYGSDVIIKYDQTIMITKSLIRDENSFARICHKYNCSYTQPSLITSLLERAFANTIEGNWTYCATLSYEKPTNFTSRHSAGYWRSIQSVYTFIFIEVWSKTTGYFRLTICYHERLTYVKHDIFMVSDGYFRP